jgi:iron complex transport system ATP-binding protein
MTSLIESKNIQHRFSGAEWELNIPRFSLLSGEILSIIGPNGSGKSTLLRILSGILSPLQGNVRLSQQELKNLDRRSIARHLGYLPQEISSEYDYTVEEIVRMGRYPHTKGFGTLNAADHEAIQESLWLTGMNALQKRRLSQLSGGEKKRAFLASVLAQNPQLLLLDEPTGALDIHHQVKFFQLLQQLARKGMGITVVTHNLNLASLFSHRLFLLLDGKCLDQGSPNKVLSSKNVHQVYGDEVLMGSHPEIDRPTLLPRISDEDKNEN